MKLQRLRVEQFRQFRAPFEITGFEPGLNLFTGPNEAGKSSLVRAIRAAFFERHRSGSLDDLLPWGEPSAAPTVELDFEIGGSAYRLRKSFMQKKRCELQVLTPGAATRQLDGEDAEQHLAELLGFRYSEKGASQAKHAGVPGLLWIEQGSGHEELLKAVAHATDPLRQVLQASVGSVTSSQGDAIVQRVRREREVLLTGTGKPRAIYADAIAARDALLQQLADLDRRIADYRAQVDRLGSLRSEQAAEAEARPWAELRAREAAAKTQLEAIDALRRQLALDQAALQQRDDTLRLLEQQLAEVEQQRRQLERRAAAWRDTETRVQAAQAAEQHGAGAQATAEAEHRAASEDLALARQEDLRGELQRRQAEATSSAAALADTLARAEAEQQELARQQRVAAETQVAKADLLRLRELQAQGQALAIRQAAAATRLRFALQPGAVLQLGDESLQAAGERLLVAATTLRLPGIGDIEIVPGGTDLATLAREAAEQQAAQAALLQRLGLASAGQAEARSLAHQQALADVRHGEKTLATLAPRGLDALRRDAAELAARQQEAAARLAQLGAPPATPAAPLAAAQARMEAATARAQALAQQAGLARQALASARAEHDAARREHEALQHTLNDPQHQARALALGERLLRARAEREALQTALAQRAREVEAARPDGLAQDVERFRRSAEQAERLFHDRQTQLTLLQGKLEEAGAQGLEELRGDTATRAEAAERRVHELARRAEALDLLLGLLESGRDALTQQLQAPLQRHLQHYLDLLWPEAQLVLGEDLAPRQLRRAGETATGAIEALSYGAREQLGVIARLAYADLLREAGRPTLLILDDALVHSDEQRLGRVKRVLYDAAQRHQVLLFTCHPAAWRDLGAAARSIDALKQPVA